jgi:hypothetical protein
VNERRLQELYEHSLSSAPGAASGCVSPDALLALVRREGPEADRMRTLDHVMTCAACLRDYELLRGIEKAGEESGATRSAVRRIWGLAPLALAASVLLLIGIGLGYERLAEGPDVPRGGGEGIVLFTPPAAVPSSAGVTFAWGTVPNAQNYELEVLDKNNTPVFSQTTRDTAVVLSAAQLRPGEYRWWVRAATPAGQLASLVRPLQVKRE